MSFEGIEHPLTAAGVKFKPGEHTKYVPNHRSFGAFIKSERMRDVTVEVAQDIAALAKQFSPESSRGGDQEGRRMKDQFDVVRNAGFIKVGGNVRVKVEVVNPARSAAPNEFGTSKNKPHRMLARAAMMIPGGSFKPDGGGVGFGAKGLARGGEE